jgi:hypothetical protein
MVGWVGDVYCFLVLARLRGVVAWCDGVMLCVGGVPRDTMQYMVLFAGVMV